MNRGVDMKRAIYLSYLLALALLAIPSAAGGQEAARAGAKVDLASARLEIQNFEEIIYGDMFSFLVNIHRAVINTPFGKYTRKNPISTEEKKERIEDIKDKLIRLLMNRGVDLRQVRTDESVTIVAFFEDRNFPEETSQNRTIVLSATKKDLDEYAKKQDKWQEFKERMTIVEY